MGDKPKCKFNKDGICYSLVCFDRDIKCSAKDGEGRVYYATKRERKKRGMK